jgi:hypothetical protein
VLTELTQDLPEALKDEITARTPLGRFGTTERSPTPSRSWPERPPYIKARSSPSMAAWS